VLSDTPSKWYTPEGDLTCACKMKIRIESDRIRALECYRYCPSSIVLKEQTLPLNSDAV